MPANPSYPDLTNIYNPSRQTSVINNEISIRKEENNNPNTAAWKKFENEFWLEIEKFRSEISFITCEKTIPGTPAEKSKFIWGAGSQRNQQIDCLFIRKNIAFYCGVTKRNEQITAKIEEFKRERDRVKRAGIKDYLSENHSQPDQSIEQIVFIFVSHKNLTDDMKDLLNSYDIPFLEKRHLSYLKSIHKAYGKHHRLAFNNFVKDILRAKVVAGNNIEVPAIQHKYRTLTNGNGHCYSFIVHPSEILDLCSVIHRKSNFDLDKSYQRFVEKSRLDSILSYVNSNKQFANNIILQSHEVKASNFSPATPAAESENHRLINDSTRGYKIGILKLPTFVGTMSIIDGQHRLFGYDGSNSENKHFVNVVLFDKTLGETEQMKLFMDINDTQKALNKNLKWELYENTLEASTDRFKISKFMNKLTRDSNFKLYKKMTLGIPLEEDKEKHVSLTIAGFCDELYITKPYNYNERLFNYLSSKFNNDNRKIEKVINGFLKTFEENCSDDWNLNSNGIILNGSVFRSLLIIMREVLDFWQSNGTFVENTSDLDNINLKFETVLENLYEWINNLEQYQKTKFKEDNKGGSAVKNIAIQFAEKIKDKNGQSDFAIHLRSLGGKDVELVDHLLNILNNCGETDDLEAKLSIYGLDPDVSNRKQTAEKQLKGCNAFFNHIGGRIIVGIEDRGNGTPAGENQFIIKGCDNEIRGNTATGNFEEYEARIVSLVKKHSNNKIRPKVKKIKYLDKNVVIISVKHKQNINSVEDFQKMFYQHIRELKDMEPKPRYGRISHKSEMMNTDNQAEFLRDRNDLLESLEFLSLSNYVETMESRNFKPYQMQEHDMRLKVY